MPLNTNHFVVQILQFLFVVMVTSVFSYFAYHASVCIITPGTGNCVCSFHRRLSQEQSRTSSCRLLLGSSSPVCVYFRSCYRKCDRSKSLAIFIVGPNSLPLYLLGRCHLHRLTPQIKIDIDMFNFSTATVLIMGDVVI